MKKTYLILGFAFTLCAVLPFSSCKEDKDDIEESEIQDPKQTEKEKKLAAKTLGVKTVLVPDENRRDVEEIDHEITDGVEIVYVSKMEEVIKQAFLS